MDQSIGLGSNSPLRPFAGSRSTGLGLSSPTTTVVIDAPEMKDGIPMGAVPVFSRPLAAPPVASGFAVASPSSPSTTMLLSPAQSMGGIPMGAQQRYPPIKPSSARKLF
jgi:hypothetical protein